MAMLYTSSKSIPRKPNGSNQRFGYSEKNAGVVIALLEQDKGRASALLKEITGPITIRQIREPNRLKPTWFAEFSVDLVPVALRLAKESNDPSTDTLEYLSIAGWTVPLGADIRIVKVPKYEQLAAIVRSLEGSNVNLQQFAYDYGITYDLASKARDFAETGKRPHWKTGKRTGTGIRHVWPVVRERAERWHREETLSPEQIGHRLREQGETIADCTVRRHLFTKRRR